MNVYQKINEVKKCVDVFKKDESTQGKGAYKYVGGAQVLAAVKSKMEELGLLFIPVKTEHRGWTTFDYTNSYGDPKTDFIVDGKLVYEWINADDPADRQRVEFEYYGQQNDISKAFGSGLTYSERYLLLKSLGIPTDEDDPDGQNENKASRSTSRPIGAGAPPRAKSKYAQIKEMADEAKMSFDKIEEWILKKYKANIKINDLTDEQFTELSAAIKGANNEN